MKKITIDAGKNVLDMKRMEKDINSLKTHLFSFLFTLKRLPEYELKWSIKDEIEPTIRKIIKMMEV